MTAAKRRADRRQDYEAMERATAGLDEEGADMTWTTNERCWAWVALFFCLYVLAIVGAYWVLHG